MDVCETKSVKVLGLLRTERNMLDKENACDITDTEGAIATVSEDLVVVDSIVDIDIIGVLDTSSVEDVPVLLESTLDEVVTFDVADTVGVIEDCVIDSVDIDEVDVRETESVKVLGLLRLGRNMLDKENACDITDTEGVVSVTEDCIMDSIDDKDIVDVRDTESVDDAFVLLGVEVNAVDESCNVADTIGVIE